MVKYSSNNERKTRPIILKLIAFENRMSQISATMRDIVNVLTFQ